MNTDPGSLDNLRDIVVPPPVSWWPPAPGWYVVIVIASAVAIVFVFRAWKRWRANAYRREALRLIGGAAVPGEIAVILKRTALAAFSRSEVASLTGDAWCDWLEEKGPGPISEPGRRNFARSVFATGEIDLEEMRRYAVSWVKRHRT